VIFSPGTLSSRSAQSRTFPHEFQDDLDWHETSTAYQTTNKQLREQWSTENHSLDEGQFIRGKKDRQLNSLDPRSGNQWLLFGAGQDSTNSGIVDAFTGKKPSMNSYVYGQSAGRSGL